MNADPPVRSRTESIVVGLLLLALSGVILWQALATDTGVGKVYVKPGRIAENGQVLTYTQTVRTDAAARLSLSRTIGVWIAALLTLCTFSYLYRDNAAYKLAESIIVGVSAGYWLVASFWDAIVDKLLVKVAPDLMRAWAVPSIPPDAAPEWVYLAPLVLGLLLFARFIPGGAWLSHWPLAFVVGTFAGLRLVSYLNADFVSQIRSTILPLAAVDAGGRFDPWLSLRNTGLIVCTLACLTYFFFSIEHKGWIGRFARLGIWVLMITFGASFAFTVMGRITLLTRRFEFLFFEWLNL
jgi:hypothetical protein